VAIAPSRPHVDSPGHPERNRVSTRLADQLQCPRLVPLFAPGFVSAASILQTPAHGRSVIASVVSPGSTW
jgi:hypothetical protein